MQKIPLLTRSPCFLIQLSSVQPRQLLKAWAWVRSIIIIFIKISYPVCYYLKTVSKKERNIQKFIIPQMLLVKNVFEVQNKLSIIYSWHEECL